MFCPQCGQERVSVATNYCNRCGFLLTGATELLSTGGMIPRSDASVNSAASPRNRGLKQGLFIFLLSFLVVPIVAILTIAVNAEPFAVVISAILLFVGGLLRMAYAMLFESTSATTEQHDPAIRSISGQRSDPHGLPPQREMPVSAYTAPPGNWRDTNDLEPASVTENTTKLLAEEEEPRLHRS